MKFNIFRKINRRRMGLDRVACASQLILLFYVLLHLVFNVLILLTTRLFVVFFLIFKYLRYCFLCQVTLEKFDYSVRSRLTRTCKFLAFLIWRKVFYFVHYIFFINGFTMLYIFNKLYLVSVYLVFIYKNLFSYFWFFSMLFFFRLLNFNYWLLNFKILLKFWWSSLLTRQLTAFHCTGFKGVTRFLIYFNDFSSKLFLRIFSNVVLIKFFCDVIKCNFFFFIYGLAIVTLVCIVYFLYVNIGYFLYITGSLIIQKFLSCLYYTIVSFFTTITYFFYFFSVSVFFFSPFLFIGQFEYLLYDASGFTFILNCLIKWQNYFLEFYLFFIYFFEDLFVFCVRYVFFSFYDSWVVEFYHYFVLSEQLNAPDLSTSTFQYYWTFFDFILIWFTGLVNKLSTVVCFYQNVVVFYWLNFFVTAWDYIFMYGNFFCNGVDILEITLLSMSAIFIFLYLTVEFMCKIIFMSSLSIFVDLVLVLINNLSLIILVYLNLVYGVFLYVLASPLTWCAWLYFAFLAFMLKLCEFWSLLCYSLFSITFDYCLIFDVFSTFIYIIRYFLLFLVGVLYAKFLWLITLFWCLINLVSFDFFELCFYALNLVGVVCITLISLFFDGVCLIFFWNDFFFKAWLWCIHMLNPFLSMYLGGVFFLCLTSVIIFYFTASLLNFIWGMSEFQSISYLKKNFDTRYFDAWAIRMSSSSSSLVFFSIDRLLSFYSIGPDALVGGAHFLRPPFLSNSYDCVAMYYINLDVFLKEVFSMVYLFEVWMLTCATKTGSLALSKVEFSFNLVYLKLISFIWFLPSFKFFYFYKSMLYDQYAYQPKPHIFKKFPCFSSFYFKFFVVYTFPVISVWSTDFFHWFNLSFLTSLKFYEIDVGVSSLEINRKFFDAGYYFRNFQNSALLRESGELNLVVLSSRHFLKNYIAQSNILYSNFDDSFANGLFDISSYFLSNKFQWFLFDAGENLVTFRLFKYLTIGNLWLELYSVSYAQEILLTYSELGLASAIIRFVRSFTLVNVIELFFSSTVFDCLSFLVLYATLPFSFVIRTPREMESIFYDLVLLRFLLDGPATTFLSKKPITATNFSILDFYSFGLFYFRFWYNKVSRDISRFKSGFFDVTTSYYVMNPYYFFELLSDFPFNSTALSLTLLDRVTKKWIFIDSFKLSKFYEYSELFLNKDAVAASIYKKSSTNLILYNASTVFLRSKNIYFFEKGLEPTFWLDTFKKKNFLNFDVLGHSTNFFFSDFWINFISKFDAYSYKTFFSGRYQHLRLLSRGGFFYLDERRSNFIKFGNFDTNLMLLQYYCPTLFPHRVKKEELTEFYDIETYFSSYTFDVARSFNYFILSSFVEFVSNSTYREKRVFTDFYGSELQDIVSVFLGQLYVRVDYLLFWYTEYLVLWVVTRIFDVVSFIGADSGLVVFITPCYFFFMSLYDGVFLNSWLARVSTHFETWEFLDFEIFVFSRFRQIRIKSYPFFMFVDT